MVNSIIKVIAGLGQNNNFLKYLKIVNYNFNNPQSLHEDFFYSLLIICIFSEDQQ